jgi:hypothetical protein
VGWVGVGGVRVGAASCTWHPAIWRLSFLTITLRPSTRNPLTALTLVVTSNSSMVRLLFWVNADLGHEISVQLAPSSLLKRLMNPERLDQSIVSHRTGLQLGSVSIVASRPTLHLVAVLHRDNRVADAVLIVEIEGIQQHDGRGARFPHTGWLPSALD